MKKISKKQFQKLNFLYTPNKEIATLPVLEKLEALKRGEGFILGKKEWPSKTYPTTRIHSFLNKRGEKKKKFTTRTLKNKQKWAILRVK